MIFMMSTALTMFFHILKPLDFVPFIQQDLSYQKLFSFHFLLSFSFSAFELVFNSGDKFLSLLKRKIISSLFFQKKTSPSCQSSYLTAQGDVLITSTTVLAPWIKFYTSPICMDFHDDLQKLQISSVCSLNRTQTACNEGRQSVRVATKFNHRTFGKLRRLHCNVFPHSHICKIATNQTSTNICKYTHRKADKFLVVAFHTTEDLLAVTMQLIQFFFNHSCIQGLAFLNELLTLHNYLLNFAVVQWNFLLESLCKRKARALSTKSTWQQAG